MISKNENGEPEKEANVEIQPKKEKKVDRKMVVGHDRPTEANTTEFYMSFRSVRN